MSAEPDPPPEEEPWPVNEYRFEAPFWMKALFSPWFAGVAPPLVLVIGYWSWRLLKG